MSSISLLLDVNHIMFDWINMDVCVCIILFVKISPINQTLQVFVQSDTYIYIITYDIMIYANNMTNPFQSTKTCQCLSYVHPLT